MKQRTVIITGANTGIGKAAAIKFAEVGHTVIMACRNRCRNHYGY
ncbi:MAG: SDR family NAD(P)-dependent oxidoreductase [Balneolaceae bacterium]|nr:SDR family NAD(P)-dependent oxidoreductase [Balneolaceae bacterium]